MKNRKEVFFRVFRFRFVYGEYLQMIVCWIYRKTTEKGNVKKERGRETWWWREPKYDRRWL